MPFVVLRDSRLKYWLSALTIAFAVLIYVSSLLLHVPNVSDGGAKHVSVVPSKVQNQNRRERTELRDLSILMQKRINYLQNPANCTSAKKLACSFQRNRCGFGCMPDAPSRVLLHLGLCHWENSCDRFRSVEILKRGLGRSVSSSEQMHHCQEEFRRWVYPRKPVQVTLSVSVKSDMRLVQ